MYPVTIRRRARPSWLLLALPATAALMMALGPGPVRGQDELFDFVPSGGRTLLESVIAAGAPQDALDTMASESRDAEGWMEWIEANRDSVPGLDALDDFESQTLAAYLEHVSPMEAAGQPGEELAEALPRDGRDLTMQYCQSCHIITVTVTQDRTRSAWLSTLNNPSHVEIDMDETERSLMADYLVLNAGIPIDLVPPPLRAGGASY
jgi:hypothetical protein